MTPRPPERGGPTVLFQAHGRRGLGHLVRAVNIAREVLALHPGTRVVVHTRTASAQAFCPADVECVVDDGVPGRSWPAVLARLAPDVVVYDTLLPAEPQPLGPGTRVVYVLRRSRPERHAALLAAPFLRRVDAVVVPHTPEEFGHALPPELARRSVFTGPVARRPDPAVQARLRDRLGLDRRRLLVSTAGGGGFAHSAGPFLAAVAATCRALEGGPLGAGVRHVVVLGPHFSGAPPALPGATVVGTEPDLVDLFALADLVVAEGGYNAVSELRVVRTPAVFLPGARTYDDQAERVQALADRGVALCLQDAAPERVARDVTALLADPARLAALRAGYDGDDLRLGNRAAAEQVLGLGVPVLAGAAP